MQISSRFFFLFVIHPLQIMSVRSTAASGASNSGYESDRAVHEYLHFHYGTEEQMMPYSIGPKSALDFMPRCANKVAEHAQEKKRALDIGCAVGRASFELSKSFDQVIGIDFSSAFIRACEDLAKNNTKEMNILEEGLIYSNHVVNLPSDVNPSRVNFEVGDACNLRDDLGTFDGILASNLLCRLPDPMKFLNRIPSLLNSGGVVVLISPYSWLEEYTPREKWIGGNPDVIDPKTSKPVRSSDALSSILEGLGLERAAPNSDFPFLIREHARKYQWGCSECQVWRKP